MRHQPHQATDDDGPRSIESRRAPVEQRRFGQDMRRRGLVAEFLVELSTAHLDEQRRSELTLAVLSRTPLVLRSPHDDSVGRRMAKSS